MRGEVRAGRREGRTFEPDAAVDDHSLPPAALMTELAGRAHTQPRVPRGPQPPVLNPTLKRTARAAAASHALPPPDPHLTSHRLPSLRLGRKRRRATSRWTSARPAS